MTRLVNKEIVRTARAKAIAQRANYAIKPGIIAKQFYVKNLLNKKVYNVDTSIHNCICPEFKRSGFCKHYAMVQEETADIARVAELEELDTYRDFAESEWEAENL